MTHDMLHIVTKPQRAPCEKRDWHVNPSPETIDKAIHMCQSCFMLQECARRALVAGSSLDGSWIHPANGVVQAGVLCTDDMETAEALAEIAGVEVPAYRDKKPRFAPPEECVTCKKPMVVRPRDGTETPDGHVNHMAHGQCQSCYARRKRFVRSQERLRKRREEARKRGWDRRTK